ncbi:MAG: lysophospholipase [candidate division Zixibacteria bacterium]|nr:lysophospholipase [candidate division Zixibacteria bacterium]
MAKMSQTVKDILQIVVFLVVVAVLVISFVVYPLNRTKALMGRPDLEQYNPDSLAINDPAVFAEEGFAADSLHIEGDVNTRLACMMLRSPGNSAAGDTAVPKGLAIMLHGINEDRTAWMPLAHAVVDAGLEVLMYDQRASGLTTGEYYGDGQLEAYDLQEVIAYLQLHNQLTRPLYIVGRDLGAEAALLTARDESRIDAVVAVTPFLSTDRWIQALLDQHDAYWIPFRKTIMWFWYRLRSSYDTDSRDNSQIEAVGCRTLMLLPNDARQDEEVAILTELSDPARLTVGDLPTDDAALTADIVAFLMTQQ